MTNSAIVTKEQAELAKFEANDKLAVSTSDKMGWSKEQLQIITDQICRGATPEELDYFMASCRRLGLDPIARQVYAVKRWDSSVKREVMSIQVSIDGIRLTAERTGKYEGQTQPQWCGLDGAWHDVWLSDKPPAAAKIGVYKTGFREPLYRIATYKEYCQKTKSGDATKFWRDFASVMLLKCAEAQALRAAFPAELSGVYTPEEMPPEESKGSNQSTGTKADYEAAKERWKAVVEPFVKALEMRDGALAKSTFDTAIDYANTNSVNQEAVNWLTKKYTDSGLNVPTESMPETEEIQAEIDF